MTARVLPKFRKKYKAILEQSSLRAKIGMNGWFYGEQTVEIQKVTKVLKQKSTVVARGNQKNWGIMFGVRPNLNVARVSHEYLVDLISHLTDIGDVVDQGFAGEGQGVSGLENKTPIL